jgi:hypothetical protein
MAESVKRRVAAARLAVAFVAAGTIAGASAWAQASPPPTAKSSILVSSYKLKLDSANIKNGSLLFQDFKAGEVVSEDSFLKFKSQMSSFKYDIKNQISSIKGELGGVETQIGDIKAAQGSFIKSSDADARYLKLDASVVSGDGSVHTATGQQKGSEQLLLLDLPGAVKVMGLQGNKIQITNNSAGPLTHTACPSGVQGGTVPAGVLDPGASLTCDGSVSELLPAVQLIGTGAKPIVMTLNFSSIDTAPPGSAGPSQDTVQILIGL